MAQQVTPATNVAREVLWTYTAHSEDNIEKDFYAALEAQVTAEITRRCLERNTRVWVGREMSLKVGPYTLQAHLTNIEPVLATSVTANTKFLVRYRMRARDEGQEVSRFIAEVIRYPNGRMEKVYQSLVGLDTIKKDLVRKLYLLLRPATLQDWLESNYAQQQPQALVQILRDRYPLFVLEGEVGSGKTALARSVGDRIARSIGSEILLLVVNAQVRGGGHVGELTQNLSRAFDEAERRQEREQLPVIILIDEADSLAQARGGRQTHHEDDAGVNTLIQRIDRLRGRPLAVLFATNLVQSLDSAILRRSCALYHFDRPLAEQRADLFRRILSDSNIDEQVVAQLVAQTEPHALPGFGTQVHRYTYSDLSQRLLPRAIEEAITKLKPLSAEHLLGACQTTLPTPEASRTEAKTELARTVRRPVKRTNRESRFNNQSQ